MIQMCGDAIVTPLMVIFYIVLNTGVFPELWKEGNIVPLHQKESELNKIYRPISLLPIFGKISENIIFNNLLFEYLQNNNMLLKNQSGFRPSDACVSQLIYITHHIYYAYDGRPSLYYAFEGRPSFERRGIFLDI